MRIFTKILSLLVLLIVFQPTNAAEAKQETLYEVEIIIFEHKNPPKQDNTTGEEQWPENPGFPHFNQSKELLSPYEKLMETSDLSNSKYYTEPMGEDANDLSAYATKIKRSDKFTLLIYKKWRQPLDSRKNTRPVFISDSKEGYLYQEYTPEETTPDTEIITESDNGTELTAEQELLNKLLAEEKLLNEPVPQQADAITEFDPVTPFDELNLPPEKETPLPEEIGPPNHHVFGLFSAFKSRFPHLTFDVFYKLPEEPVATEEIPAETTITQDAPAMAATTAEPAELASSEEIPGDAAEQEIIEQIKKPIAAVRLSESSRIRLNELHYFDHPEFGVIARIRKYEPPVEESAAAE